MGRYVDAYLCHDPGCGGAQGSRLEARTERPYPVAIEPPHEALGHLGANGIAGAEEMDLLALRGGLPFKSPVGGFSFSHRTKYSPFKASRAPVETPPPIETLSTCACLGRCSLGLVPQRIRFPKRWLEEGTRRSLSGNLLRVSLVQDDR